jgi:hypothetical protein
MVTTSYGFPVLLLTSIVDVTCFLHRTEISRREAFNLHKESSNSFALYKKRPQRVKVKRSAASAAQSALLAGYQFDLSDAHVKAAARELVKSIPTYEEEIQVSAQGSAC